MSPLDSIFIKHPTISLLKNILFHFTFASFTFYHHYLPPPLHLHHISSISPSPFHHLHFTISISPPPFHHLHFTTSISPSPFHHLHFTTSIPPPPFHHHHYLPPQVFFTAVKGTSSCQIYFMTLSHHLTNPLLNI